MEIRRIGIAICLMGAAYTASAGYAWSDFQAKAPPAQKPALVTQGNAWSDYQPKTPPGEDPKAVVHGYAWSD